MPKENEIQRPLVPVLLKEDGSGLTEAVNALIKNMQWVNKHFSNADNFVCACGRNYSPSAKQCPNCHPSGPTLKRSV